MFTGIVQATAPILAKTPEGLTVQRPSGFDAIKEGSSICVSGVCLSVIAFDEHSMRFDVIEETWARTKLGGLKEGSQVNLEQALLAAGRFDGNIVQGHVEGVGQVVAHDFQGILSVRVPSELLRYIASKGAITLDGVALTVTTIEADVCSVALIPHTLTHTTIGKLLPGDPVNIETDVLARYAERILESRS